MTTPITPTAPHIDLDLVLLNISNGAHDSERWNQIATDLTDDGPADLVLLNECAKWNQPGAPYLDRAAHSLDMKVAGITAVAARRGQPSVILYRPDVLGERSAWHDNFPEKFLHGCGTVEFTPPGLGAPLAVTVGHLDPHTRAGSVVEAQIMATSAMLTTQVYALIGGDMNSSPLHGPEYGYPPNLARMTEFNKATRLNNPRGPNPTPNTDVAEEFAAFGFEDAADLAYAATGDRTVYAHTGKSDRIDRWHLRPGMTVISYQRRTTASDHAKVRIRVRLHKVA